MTMPFFPYGNPETSLEGAYHKAVEDRIARLEQQVHWLVEVVELINAELDAVRKGPKGPAVK